MGADAAAVAVAVAVVGVTADAVVEPVAVLIGSRIARCVVADAVAVAVAGAVGAILRTIGNLPFHCTATATHGVEQKSALTTA